MIWPLGCLGGCQWRFICEGSSSDATTVKSLGGDEGAKIIFKIFRNIHSINATILNLSNTITTKNALSDKKGKKYKIGINPHSLPTLIVHTFSNTLLKTTLF